MTWYRVVALSVLLFIIVISTSLQMIRLDQNKVFGQHDHFELKVDGIGLSVSL